MGDGDKIKSHRLRSNLYPTRYLSNRRARDPKARLCRRSGQHDETAFHIFQKCTFVHNPKIAHHNFIEQSIIKKLAAIHPEATITTEKVIIDTLRVNYYLHLPNKTYVLDEAVPWDNSGEVAEYANTAKRLKYDPILQVATKPTKVLGLAFGARGLVCPTTRRAAKEIKIRTLHGWLLAHWSAASFV